MATSSEEKKELINISASPIRNESTGEEKEYTQLKKEEIDDLLKDTPEAQLENGV